MSNNPNLLIVDAHFYSDIADELVRGAVARIDSSGASFERISVSGALEIPVVISYALLANKKTSRSWRFDGFVALGCVIRGETSHYDHVCFESIHGVQDLALKYSLALGNGILTCENREQAWVRAAVDQGNKGGVAASVALELIKIRDTFV